MRHRAKKIAVAALKPGDRLIYDVVYTWSAALIPGQLYAFVSTQIRYISRAFGAGRVNHQAA